MRRLIVVLAAAAALIPTSVIAGNTQVSPSSFKAAGKTGHVGGRSDGIFQEENTKSVYVIENGQSANPIGVGVYEAFGYGDGKGLTCVDAGGATSCAGNSATVSCLCTTGKGNRFDVVSLLQQDIAPDMDATGLDIGQDQTADDGVEVIGGGVGGSSGRPYVVGDDPAFYFCATLTLSDVSGTDDLHVGFRETEAVNATFDNYTDLASIGAISGAITIETILGNAATVTTDTTNTWADAASKKLCIYVSAAGVVTYTINDAAPTATAAYTFADGLAVVPFIHYLHDSDVCDEIVITKWETGFQP